MHLSTKHQANTFHKVHFFFFFFQFYSEISKNESRHNSISDFTSTSIVLTKRYHYAIHAKHFVCKFFKGKDIIKTQKRTLIRRQRFDHAVKRRAKVSVSASASLGSTAFPQLQQQSSFWKRGVFRAFFPFGASCIFYWTLPGSKTPKD